MPEPILGAFILAGGKSSRFGSDKARADIHGVPLLLRLIESLTAVTHLDITLVVNEPQRYSDFGLATVVDIHRDLGPMGGLYSAIESIVKRNQGGWILLLPCDLLNYDTAWHQAFLNRLQSDSTHASAIAFCDEQWLPFPALYHTSLLPCLQNAIQMQQLSPRILLTSLGDKALGISIRDLPPIRSINTPAELEQYLKSEEGLD
jgi:molybdopterin-guanine dinucleotide biosynthesis protein A